MCVCSYLCTNVDVNVYCMQHVQLHVFTYDLLCFLFVLLFVLLVCDIYLVCYRVLLFLFALSVVIQTCFVFCSLAVGIVCCIIAVLFVLTLCFVVSLLCFFLVILVRVFFWFRSLQQVPVALTSNHHPMRHPHQGTHFGTHQSRRHHTEVKHQNFATCLLDKPHKYRSHLWHPPT